MSMTALFVAGALGLAPQMTTFAEQLECLTKLVTGESSLVRSELPAADAAVALSAYNRMLDGRWGPSICSVVHSKWPRTGYKMIKQRSKASKGKKALVRLVKKAYKTVQHDYSFLDKKYSVGLMEKVSDKQLAKARDAALAVLTGTYKPPAEIAGTMHYQYREKSGTTGNRWFDCVLKPLGRAHEGSVHIHYRDATEPELKETFEQKPECHKYITAFRWSRDRNDRKKLTASVY